MNAPIVDRRVHIVDRASNRAHYSLQRQEDIDAFSVINAACYLLTADDFREAQERGDIGSGVAFDSRIWTTSDLL